MRDTLTSPTDLRAIHWRFPLALLAFLLALMAWNPPSFGGDVVEYALETVAFADHGSPEIRLADVDRTLKLAPNLAGPLGQLREGMVAGDEKLYAAFLRGREGKVYSIHALAYPLLATPAFVLFEALGLPPFKAFQAVNYAAVFVLGLALLRFFGSGLKAAFGIALFLGCAGILYLNWTSPECLSAACLLAGLLLFLSGAPLAGGLLGGVAGLQNPTIVFFFAFAPLLKLLLEQRPGAGPAASLRALLQPRLLAGLAAGLAVYALPIVFSLAVFGVPNVIAKYFSRPDLASFQRVLSFFFDLNQGMILAIPGVVLALGPWGWGRARTAAEKRRALHAALVLCPLFTLVLMLPSLAVPNWNSGAVGVMRYAFWSSMPILLALLLRLRAHPRWPAALLLALAALQAGAMLHASSYIYTRFSPLAKLALAHAPYWYHPDPEIFAERASNNDDYVWPYKVYVFDEPGLVRKTLYCPAEARSDAMVCGPGAEIAPDNRFTESVGGWRYIDGPVHCRPRGAAGSTIHKGIFAIGQLCQDPLP